eukprot:3940248-Rhodomonas_salina.3
MAVLHIAQLRGSQYHTPHSAGYARTAHRMRSIIHYHILQHPLISVPQHTAEHGPSQYRSRFAMCMHTSKVG